jgi:hypothetical protein
VIIAGSNSTAATSITIPTHQAGDVIIIAARGTAAAPSVPAAGGTVPAWATIQSGIANSIGLTVVAFTATGAGHTSGVFTNATHMIVVLVRPDASKQVLVSAARSSVGNANNTQTIVYPALTFQILTGFSLGLRFGTRTVAVTAVGTAPTNWANQSVQPSGSGALMALHYRLNIVSSPTADSVSTAGTNAPYRAVTMEVQEIDLSQSLTAGSVSSAQAFGAVGYLQRIQVDGVYPPLSVRSITGQVISGDGHLVGYSTGSQFGPVIVIVRFAAYPAGLGSAQSFGTISTKATIVVPIAGVGSAQQFSNARFNFRLPVLGLASAQAFGAVRTDLRFAVIGVVSTQQFGAVITRSGFSQAVTGVLSAQAFGLVRPANVAAVFGLGSAQAFGALQLNYFFFVSGIPSAQLFGAATIGLKVRNVWIWPTDWVSSVQEAPICGQVICGDGHLVGGWEYLPASEDPETLVLEPAEVETLLLVPTVSK